MSVRNCHIINFNNTIKLNSVHWKSCKIFVCCQSLSCLLIDVTWQITELESKILKIRLFANCKIYILTLELYRFLLIKINITYLIWYSNACNIRSLKRIFISYISYLFEWMRNNKNDHYKDLIDIQTKFHSSHCKLNLWPAIKSKKYVNGFEGLLKEAINFIINSIYSLIVNSHVSCLIQNKKFW